jgi:hypothetical protein
MESIFKPGDVVRVMTSGQTFFWLPAPYYGIVSSIRHNRWSNSMEVVGMDGVARRVSDIWFEPVDPFLGSLLINQGAFKPA